MSEDQDDSPRTAGEQLREWIGVEAESALALVDALEAELAEARRERDEWKQAAGAEAFAADEFRARLVAAKSVMPEWTEEAWNQFIDAALALEAELAEARRERDEARKQLLAENVRVIYYKRLLPENARLTREREEARDLARNLFNMIDRETWRATGGDDGQGHYEGDGYAERVAVEIQSWQRGEALASSSEGDTA